MPTNKFKYYTRNFIQLFIHIKTVFFKKKFLINLKENLFQNKVFTIIFHTYDFKTCKLYNYIFINYLIHIIFIF